MKGRHKRLLIVLIKVSIMFLVITGIILINRNYIKKAEGSEKDGQKISIEREADYNFYICHSEFISESNASNNLAAEEIPKRVRDDNSRTACQVSF